MSPENINSISALTNILKSTNLASNKGKSLIDNNLINTKALENVMMMVDNIIGKAVGNTYDVTPSKVEISSSRLRKLVDERTKNAVVQRKTSDVVPYSSDRTTNYWNTTLEQPSSMAQPVSNFGSRNLFSLQKGTRATAPGISQNDNERDILVKMYRILFDTRADAIKAERLSRINTEEAEAQEKLKHETPKEIEHKEKHEKIQEETEEESKSIFEKLGGALSSILPVGGRSRKRSGSKPKGKFGGGMLGGILGAIGAKNLYDRFLGGEGSEDSSEKSEDDSIFNLENLGTGFDIAAVASLLLPGGLLAKGAGMAARGIGGLGLMGGIKKLMGGAKALTTGNEAKIAAGTAVAGTAMYGADQNQNFFNDVYTKTFEAAKARGMENPDVIARLAATQSSLETGYGHHAPNNNYFGIKGKGGSYMTTEIENGKPVQKMQSFAGYKSFEDSIQGYLNTLQRNPTNYGKTLASKNIDEAIKNIHESPYAGDTAYDVKLRDIYRKYGINVGPATIQQSTTNSKIQNVDNPTSSSDNKDLNFWNSKFDEYAKSIAGSEMNPFKNVDMSPVKSVVDTLVQGYQNDKKAVQNVSESYSAGKEVFNKFNMWELLTGKADQDEKYMEMKYKANKALDYSGLSSIGSGISDLISKIPDPNNMISDKPEDIGASSGIYSIPRLVRPSEGGGWENPTDMELAMRTWWWNQKEEFGRDKIGGNSSGFYSTTPGLNTEALMAETQTGWNDLKKSFTRLWESPDMRLPEVDKKYDIVPDYSKEIQTENKVELQKSLEKERLNQIEKESALQKALQQQEKENLTLKTKNQQVVVVNQPTQQMSAPQQVIQQQPSSGVNASVRNDDPTFMNLSFNNIRNILP